MNGKPDARTQVNQNPALRDSIHCESVEEQFVKI